MNSIFPETDLKLAAITIVLLAFATPVCGQEFTDGSTKLDVEGWPVVIDKELAGDKNAKQAALTALANHLQRIKYIAPGNRVKQLQQLPIRVDLNYEALSSMQYHPSTVWLKNNGHDPKLAKHVHIPRAAHLTDRRQWAKHPYVVLHELAHAYHDQILGFNHHEIKSAYKSAKQSGIYESVLLSNGQKVRHYGLNNEKEYFAEMTECYFGVNDFYPFVRAELKHHDPKMYSLLRKIWGEID